jgi:hypothetical protein
VEEEICKEEATVVTNVFVLVIALDVETRLVGVGSGVGIPGGNLSVVLTIKSALLQRISNAGADKVVPS